MTINKSNNTLYEDIQTRGMILLTDEKIPLEARIELADTFASSGEAVAHVHKEVCPYKTGDLVCGGRYSLIVKRKADFWMIFLEGTTPETINKTQEGKRLKLEKALNIPSDIAKVAITMPFGMNKNVLRLVRQLVNSGKIPTFINKEQFQKESGFHPLSDARTMAAIHIAQIVLTERVKNVHLPLSS